MKLLTNEITMTTTEIAKLVGESVYTVRLAARTMLAELGYRLADFSEGDEYRLPKEETILLASGFSVQMRKRMLDRIKELEAQRNNLPDFSDPVAAARAWADAQEQLALAAPKVRLAEQLTDTTNLYGIREVSALVEVKEKRLKEVMSDYGYWYRDQSTGQTRAFAAHRSLFPLKTEIINGYPRQRLMITGEGLEVIHAVLENAE